MLKKSFSLVFNKPGSFQKEEQLFFLMSDIIRCVLNQGFNLDKKKHSTFLKYFFLIIHNSSSTSKFSIYKEALPLQRFFFQ